MADGKSPLTPSRLWSPHSAALHRRRQLGDDSKSRIISSLTNLNFDDDDDDNDKDHGAGNNNHNNSSSIINNNNSSGTDTFQKFSPGKSPGRKSNSRSLTASVKDSLNKKYDAEKELQESLAKLSPQVREKLAKIFNKATPMKERIQIEIEMMKHPEEGPILSDFKWKVERKQFNIQILESIESQQELLDRNLAEEAKRAKKEQMELAKKRQEKIEEEIAQKERELEIERQVKIHKAKNIAMGAEELRKDAEKSAEAAIRNKKKKDQLAKEREEKIQAFLNGPGKQMTHVERELKIARMMNDGEI